MLYSDGAKPCSTTTASQQHLGFCVCISWVNTFHLSRFSPSVGSLQAFESMKLMTTCGCASAVADFSIPKVLLQKWAQHDLHPNKFSPLVQFTQLSTSKFTLLFLSERRRSKGEKGVLHSVHPPGFWKPVEQTFLLKLNLAPSRRGAWDDDCR